MRRTSPQHSAPQRSGRGRAPCHFWAQGNCRKGDSCDFSHDAPRHTPAPAHHHNPAHHHGLQRSGFVASSPAPSFGQPSIPIGASVNRSNAFTSAPFGASVTHAGVGPHVHQRQGGFATALDRGFGVPQPAVASRGWPAMAPRPTLREDASMDGMHAVPVGSSLPATTALKQHHAGFGRSQPFNQIPVMPTGTGMSISSLSASPSGSASVFGSAAASHQGFVPHAGSTSNAFFSRIKPNGSGAGWHGSLAAQSVLGQGLVTPSLSAPSSSPFRVATDVMSALTTSMLPSTNSVSAEDMAAFQADSFVYGLIPTVPPPPGML